MILLKVELKIGPFVPLSLPPSFLPSLPCLPFLKHELSSFLTFVYLKEVLELYIYGDMY